MFQIFFTTTPYVVVVLIFLDQYIERGKFGGLKYDSLEMPVPSQGHYGFHSFSVVD